MENEELIIGITDEEYEELEEKDNVSD